MIITITGNEPWNTETHKTDRDPPITNHKPRTFEPVKVKFCFLRGPLRWLTAAKNAIVRLLLNFRIRMFVKSAVTVWCYKAKKWSVNCYRGTPIQTLVLGFPAVTELYTSFITSKFPFWFLMPWFEFVSSKAEKYPDQRVGKCNRIQSIQFNFGFKTNWLRNCPDLFKKKKTNSNIT